MTSVPRWAVPGPVSVLSLALSIALGSAVIYSGHLWAQDQKGPASKRMADGKQWTTRNLDVNTVPSYCYDEAEQKCQQYGRLYTWESARQACQSLGTGWRLPREEEWRQLARQYGGVSEDAADRGRAAYAALLMRGNSGFHAVLGGGRSEAGQYARLEAHGFYWTAGENGPDSAWFYNFGKGGLALHRQREGEKQSAFSVRCIKE